MDRAKLRQALPIVYGAIVAVLWVTVQGPPAMIFTMVGGILLGLFYALDRPDPEGRALQADDPER